MSHPGFHGKIEKDGKYPPAKGRYVLYCSLSCPYVHRSLISHALKGLDDVVQIVYVHPVPSPIDIAKNQRTWAFGGFQDTPLYPGVEASIKAVEGKENVPQSVKEYIDALDTRNTICYGVNTVDAINNRQTMKQVYELADSTYDGRYTVPVLFDTVTGDIINNESAEICAIFDHSFDEFATNPSWTMHPTSISTEQLTAGLDDVQNGFLSQTFKGVIARSQLDYIGALDATFAYFDKLDQTLTKQRFAAGNEFSEVDIRLIVALLRFDVVFAPYLRSHKYIADYPNVAAYLRDVYQNVFNDKAREFWSPEQSRFSFFAFSQDTIQTGVIPMVPSFDLTPIVDRSQVAIGSP